MKAVRDKEAEAVAGGEPVRCQHMLAEGCCTPFDPREHHANPPDDCRCDLRHHPARAPQQCPYLAANGQSYCPEHAALHQEEAA